MPVRAAATRRMRRARSGAEVSVFGRAVISCGSLWLLGLYLGMSMRARFDELVVAMATVV